MGGGGGGGGADGGGGRLRTEFVLHNYALKQCWEKNKTQETLRTLSQLCDRFANS